MTLTLQLQTLETWSCRKEVVLLVLGYLAAYQARLEIGAPGIAFVYVQPFGGDDLPLLLALHVCIDASSLEELHLGTPCQQGHAMIELRATDIIVGAAKLHWRITFLGWLGSLGTLLGAHEGLDRLADLEILYDLAPPLGIGQLLSDALAYQLHERFWIDLANLGFSSFQMFVAMEAAALCLTQHLSGVRRICHHCSTHQGRRSDAVRALRLHATKFAEVELRGVDSSQSQHVSHDVCAPGASSGRVLEEE